MLRIDGSNVDMPHANFTFIKRTMWKIQELYKRVLGKCCTWVQNSVIVSSVISMAQVRSGLRSDQEAEDGHQPRVLHCLSTLLIISIQLRVYIHISYGSDSFSGRTETLVRQEFARWPVVYDNIAISKRASQAPDQSAEYGVFAE